MSESESESESEIDFCWYVLYCTAYIWGGEVKWVWWVR